MNESALEKTLREDTQNLQEGSTGWSRVPQCYSKEVLGSCNKNCCFLSKRYSTCSSKIFCAMTLHLDWNVQPHLLLRIGSHEVHRLNVAKCLPLDTLSSSKGPRGKNCSKVLHILIKPSFDLILFNSQHMAKRMTEAFVTKSHFLPLLGLGNKGNKNVNFRIWVQIFWSILISRIP